MEKEIGSEIFSRRIKRDYRVARRIKRNAGKIESLTITCKKADRKNLSVLKDSFIYSISKRT
jgi:hypothetical protein